MESKQKQRDHTWDVLKFILIVLVILGHWLFNNYDNTINRIAYNFRGLFTIPLFVFISGYFSRKKDTSQFVNQLLHLFETYVIVQVLFVVSSYFLLHRPFAWKAIYTPNYAAWFLLSLIYWRVLLQVIPEKWLTSKLIVPICILVSLVAGFIPIENELAIQRTLAFSPFFVCGYHFKQKIEFGTASYRMNWLCVCVIIAVLIGSCIFLNRDVTYVIWCSSSYYTPHHSIWALFSFRIFFLAVASTMAFCILKIIPKTKNSSLLSRMGEDTMYYYVYHVLIMRVGIVIINHFHLPLAFPAMIMYTILTVVLIYFLVKIKLFRNILNPVSNFIQSVNNNSYV